MPLFGRRAALVSGTALLLALAGGRAHADEDAPETVSVMDLMVDGASYAGHLVRVQGEAVEGDGNLRKETRRGKADWVLRDECCDAWITAAKGDPPQPPQAEHGLDVVGRVQVEGSIVYIQAERVTPTPPRPKPTIRLTPTREGGGTFLHVCEKVDVRVDLIGEVPDIPMRWELSVEDETVASGDVPFRYEGVPQREWTVTVPLMFSAFLGGSREAAERQLLSGGGLNSSGEPGQREMHFSLRIEETDSGKIVAEGRTDPMGDCAPPSCYYDRGCLQREEQ